METGVPKQIGRYRVDRLLGSGAMGFVYLGQDPELDRPVAIKTVRDFGLSEDRLATFLERFRNEARAAARLLHPSIVQVYDVGADPSAGPFVVFEYVAGSTLKQILKSRGPLEPLAVVRLAEQIADALDTAHAHEIIHRDLKPDNLLVTHDGRTKLADFGVARVPDAALTKEGQFLGTPCYAAPETLAEGRYSHLSDLFSLAAVLYEAASGVRAFTGDEAVAVAHKVIHDEPPPPSAIAKDGARIPPAVEAVILRGLSKKPALRFESGQALAEALRAAYEASGSIEPGAGLGRPESVRIRTVVPIAAAQERARSGALVFGGILAASMAIGVGLVFAFRSDEPDDAFADGTEEPSTNGARGNAREPGHGADSVDPSFAHAPAGEALETGLPEATGDDVASAVVEPEKLARMTAHEREEAAKDALTKARLLMSQRDFDGAALAVAEARAYDPENPDVTGLEDRLRAQASQDP